MDLAELKREIEQLPSSQREELAAWFRRRKALDDLVEAEIQDGLYDLPMGDLVEAEPDDR